MTLELALLILVLISAGSFTRYGLLCMYSSQVRREYRRYGIPRLRVMNGSLMLFGSGGIMLGLLFWPLGVLASSCLSLMMMLGLLARVRLGDSRRLMVPAATLAMLNWAITWLFGIAQPMSTLL